MRAYDAGLERQWLAETLADWNDCGFISLALAQRFERRLPMLARVLGWSRDRVLAQARGDAEQIHMNDQFCS